MKKKYTYFTSDIETLSVDVVIASIQSCYIFIALIDEGFCKSNKCVDALNLARKLMNQSPARSDNQGRGPWRNPQIYPVVLHNCNLSHSQKVNKLLTDIVYVTHLGSSLNYIFYASKELNTLVNDVTNTPTPSAPAPRRRNLDRLYEFIAKHMVRVHRFIFQISDPSTNIKH